MNNTLQTPLSTCDDVIAGASGGIGQGVRALKVLLALGLEVAVKVAGSPRYVWSRWFAGSGRWDASGF
jgi:hypothetical protein